MTSVVETTTRTAVRLRARPASTRKRMAASSRAAVARALRRSPRRRAWRSAARTSAATTRSAVGSASSAAKSRNAADSGSRSNRATKSATSARMAGGATGAVAAMACSSPAAPAIVSRSISAQAAMASVRATSRPPRRPPAEELRRPDQANPREHGAHRPAGQRTDHHRGTGGGTDADERDRAAVPVRSGPGQRAPPAGDGHEQADADPDAAHERDGGHLCHHPSGRSSSARSRPAAAKSSAVSVRIRVAGTALPSGPGRKTSLDTTRGPSASRTSRTEAT